MDQPKQLQPAPPLPEIHHVTEGWHELHGQRDAFGRQATIGRVCEHWVSYNATTAAPVLDREGRHVMAGPGPVRSYIGLVLEVGDAQLQVRGRLLLGDDRMKIELVG